MKETNKSRFAHLYKKERNVASDNSLPVKNDAASVGVEHVGQPVPPVEKAETAPVDDSLTVDQSADDINKRLDILASDFDTIRDCITRQPALDVKQLEISLCAAVKENMEQTLVAMQEKGTAEREGKYDTLLKLVKQINDEVLRIKTALSIMIDLLELMYKRLGGDEYETNAPANTNPNGKAQKDKKDSLSGTSERTANIDADASKAKGLSAWLKRDSVIILPNFVVIIYAIFSLIVIFLVFYFSFSV